MSRTLRPVLKIYTSLSPADRAQLVSRALARGDQPDITQLLRTCPRISGSIRDPQFVAACVDAHPELIGRFTELLDFDPAGKPALFQVVVERLPASLQTARELLDAIDARQEKGVA